MWLSCFLGAVALSSVAEARERGATGGKSPPVASSKEPSQRAKARASARAKRVKNNAAVASEPAPASSTPPPSTAPAAAPAEPATAAVEASPSGEKTFTFEAQQIEGRLKAPQILYFLRRVRAEFDAQALGHRSFLLELSDTRRHRALR